MKLKLVRSNMKAAVTAVRTKRAVTENEKSPLGIDPKFYDPSRDGVTQGLLALFKNCREAARLSLLGWTSTRISPSLIFGTLVHAALEDVYLRIQKKTLTSIPTPKEIDKLMRRLEAEWRKENPKADHEVLQHLEMSVLLAVAILPIYFTYWHKDLTKISWQALEHEFKMPIVVAGMPTFIRGKMDGQFKPERDKRNWLLETKTKSRLGEQGESNLVDVLPRNIQVNVYLGAMQAQNKETPGGVLYNIIRRPNLSPKKGESLVIFSKRIAADVQKRPDHYFIRLRMSVDAKDLARELAKRDAVLVDFLKWIRGEAPHYDNDSYCENKFGSCPNLPICANGDYSRHFKRPTVFRELAEDV